MIDRILCWQSNREWVLHAVATIFALLVYGAERGYLARYPSALS